MKHQIVPGQTFIGRPTLPFVKIRGVVIPVRIRALVHVHQFPDGSGKVLSGYFPN